MAVSQSLTVSEVPNSQSTMDNTSRVRILWTSTQTGVSHNDNTKTAYYFVSVNGGSEIKYSVSYTLPQSTTKTILDTVITVPHKDDGSGTVTVRTYMETGISAGTVEKSHTIELTTITRASKPSCITFPENTQDIGYFGSTVRIYMNSKSNDFTHTVSYWFGSKKGVIAENVKDYVDWFVDYELIYEVPDSKKGFGSILVDTYNGESKVGSESCAVIINVPDNEFTKPSITALITPIHQLNDNFSDLFIQGVSRVKAVINADCKYGAYVKSYSMTVEGETYGAADDYISNILLRYDTKTISITAVDSREIANTIQVPISVIAYSKPKILPAESENDIICARCDKNGNIDDSGTYLKIKARRSYSKVLSDDGIQKNYCSMQYRYATVKTPLSDDWTTVLEKSELASNTFDSEPLLDGVLLPEASYLVQIGVKDDISDVVTTTAIIPTDKVQSHEGRDFLALGQYSDKGGFECNWDAHFYKGLYLDNDAVTDFITESGYTEGLLPWIYKKYKDGTVICWGKKYVGDVEITTAWGDIFESGPLNDIYPSNLFCEPPHCFVEVSAAYSVFKTVDNNGTASMTPNVYLSRATAATVPEVSIYFFAIGRWKQNV